MQLSDLSSELQSILQGVSSQFGTDANTLATLAGIESSGNVNKPNGGLFQVQGSNVSTYGITNIYDPNQNASAAAQIWNGISNQYSALGYTQNWQTYLGYQQGPTGGLALLQADPNMSAAAALQQYAGLSPSLAQQSIAGNLPSWFNNGNPGAATVGQLQGYWQNVWQNGGQYTGGTTTPSNPQGLTSNVAANTSAGNDSSSWSGWASHWIVRVFVFLSGIVFLTVGLFMLSKTGQLTISMAKQNAAGNLANAVTGGAPVQRYAITEQPPVPEPKAPRVVVKTARRRSENRGEGLGTGAKIRVKTKRMADLKKMAGVE